MPKTQAFRPMQPRLSERSTQGRTVFRTLLVLALVLTGLALVPSAAQALTYIVGQYGAFAEPTFSFGPLNPSDLDRVSTLVYMALPLTFATPVYDLFLTRPLNRLLMRKINRTAQAAHAQEQMRMMELQLSQQREQYESLSEGIAQARRARHDMRYSLAALQGFACVEDTAGLKDYLNQLIGALPEDQECPYCANYAVNAVARRYLGQARGAGVQVTSRLDVPRVVERAVELDLCVLVGNLLENAAEACAHVGEASRRIDAVSVMDGEYLTIVITNSFDGQLSRRGDAYLSRKHEGEGIGINSIRDIAEKYDGHASFAANGGIFEASAILHLGLIPHEN